MLHRAKYYSENNLSISVNLDRAEEVITAFDPNVTKRDINDILEYYNIIQFFDRKLYLVSWSEKTVKEYIEIVNQFKAVIGRFLHSVQGDDLSRLYEETDIVLRDDFFKVITHYKVTERISDNHFSSFLDEHPHAMQDIIREKYIVSKYGKVIANHLTSNFKYAEYVLDHFFTDKETHTVKTYMPSELDESHIDQIIQNYVEWEDANLNYVKLISMLKKTDGYPISDRVRLRAHKRVQAFWADHFKNSKENFSFAVEIKFSQQDEPILETFDNSNKIEYLSYSRQWLEDNLDYPTLLNNFIYLFKYVDKHYRCQFLSNPVHLGIIESMSGVHSFKEYKTGVGFEGISLRSRLQMYAYQKALRLFGVEIENLFKWFFEEYLKVEFGVEGFYYTAPSSQASFIERILLLASQMDAVPKQFRLFVDDGHINRELFEFSSGIYRIVDTPSMIENKYLYCKSETINRRLYDLFSNQSLLSYPNKTGEKYDCFAKLLINEDIRADDYAEFLQNELKWLIESATLFTDENGILRIKKSVFNLLFDLHYNGNIAYSYCSKAEKALAEELLKKGELFAESSLFTRQEQNYLDYMLNVQQFINGPELRNKYVHGNGSLDPKTQEADYIEMLKIMTLIVLKINEEFCLKYPSETTSNVIIV